MQKYIYLHHQLTWTDEKLIKDTVLYKNTIIFWHLLHYFLADMNIKLPFKIEIPLRNHKNKEHLKYFM